MKWFQKLFGMGAVAPEPPGGGSAQAKDARHRGWRATLVATMIVGFAVVVAFAWQRSAPPRSPAAMAALLLSGGCTLVGGFVGFLFGIPRSLQHKEPATNDQSGDGDRVGYRPNTNLEEISDWLTKILVGVGLTQLLEIPRHLQRFARYAAPGLGGDAEVAERFVLAIVLYFPTIGFVFGYLWTRLFLGGALREADRVARIEAKLNAQEQQAQVDATALSMAYNHLSPGATPVDVPKLKQAIRSASPSVKVQAFNQARTARQASEKGDRQRIDRTIPIFEALIDSDKEAVFHRNYAQLGYALKDQLSPDWARAERALSSAIRIRGDWASAGWTLYELNRAVCRIMQDAEFKAKRPSSPAAREKILADLRVGAHSEFREMFREPPVDEWLRLNNLTETDLTQPAP